MSSGDGVLRLNVLPDQHALVRGRGRDFRRLALVAGITLLAVLVRVAWALAPRTVRWDEPDYLILARNLLQGAGYQVFGVPELIWPPGPPFLAAAAMAIGVPPEAALLAWHVIAGAAACALLFGLVRDVTGDRRLAAFAALMAAVAPALAAAPLYWGSLTEAPFVCLLLIGLWATWRFLVHGSAPAGGVAGVAFGLSYLVRTEGFAWWALYLLPALVLAVRSRRPVRRRRIAGLALYLLGFILCAAPYVAYLHQHTGQLLLTGKAGINLMMSPQVLALGGAGQDFAASLDSTGQEIMWLSPERFEYSWSDLFAGDPRGMLRLIWLNVKLAGDALSGPILGIIPVLLVALGLAGEMWSRPRWREELFWLAALVPLGVLFLSKVETRYLLPLVPVALVWAARGILHLGGWLAATLRRGPAASWATLLLVGLLGLGLWGQWQAAREGQAGLTPSHEAAGRWLGGISVAGEKVMSRNSELGFYADRPLVAFPDATWEQVVAYARARGARYLITDDWELRRLRPQLSFLADPAAAPPELEYLRAFSDTRRTTYVYRFVD